MPAADHPSSIAAEAADSAGLLLGPAEIGSFLGPDFSERRTRRLLRLGVIPSFRLGGRAAATKASLRDWLAGNAERARAECEARAAVPSAEAAAR